jgi:hypothetical protein
MKPRDYLPDPKLPNKKKAMSIQDARKLQKKENQKTVELAILRRVVFRIFAFFVYVFLIVAGFIYISKYLAYINDKHTLPTESNVYLEINNCYLNVIDSSDVALTDMVLITTEIPGAFDIDFQHETSYSSFRFGSELNETNSTNSTNLSNSSNTSASHSTGDSSKKRSNTNRRKSNATDSKEINNTLNSSFNRSNDTYRYVFHNVLSPDNCKVNMIIGPSNKPALGNLSINCTSVCYILQQSNRFHVKDNIHIDGVNDVYFNSIDMKTKVFNFSATRGLVQLNHFEIEKYANISLKDGNVILQSTKDFTVNWTHSVPSYCFSAPFFSEAPEIHGCHYGTFKIIILLYLFKFIYI